MVDEKWKKIIQFGKKVRTNMPFYQIVPSPSTALKKVHPMNMKEEQIKTHTVVIEAGETIVVPLDTGDDDTNN